MKRLPLLLAFFCLALSALAQSVKHNYDLKHVLWKLSLDMHAGTIAGDVTNTLTLSEDSPTVELNCSELNVKKVWVNGSLAKFGTKDDKLTVTLPNAGKTGQQLAIRTVYTGAPTNGFYFVPAKRAFPAHTPAVYTQGEGEDNHYWLPTYDFPDDKATTESFVTVPESWTAIANGALIGVKNNGSTHTYHWRMDQPHSTYLISLVAGPYVGVTDHWRKVPVSFYVQPGLVEEGKASFGATPKMIDLYSKLTGVDYPYAKFAQETVSDFMFGGMENITAVTQTVRTLHLPSSEPVADSTYLVAHELAHHWFGDLITCRTWEHSWLNEGFATTLPVFYDRATRGQDYFDIERYRNFEGAVDTIGSRGRKDVGGTVGDVPTVTMGSVYDGGCSRIMMLYHMLGEETFWKAIHEFLTTYAFQPATTDDFFNVFNRVSGQDLSGFEKQWFHTSATPSITATIERHDLVLTQLSPYYTFDLPVWAWNGEDWVKKSIHVEGKESRVDLADLSDHPLLIDPEVWTPMELKYDIQFQPKDVAIMYEHAPNVAQRARIISELFDTLPSAQRIAIAHGEKFQGLLQMICTHIPQEGGTYLLELTHHADPRVVNAAVVAMGNLKFSGDFESRLKEIAKYDTNELIREHAVQALLNWSKDRAFVNKVYEMKAFDDGYRRMAMDWYAKNAPGDARDICLDYLTHPDAEPTRVKAIQILGNLKEEPGQHDVFDALVPIAKETSYNARSAAVVALGQLGNKKAIPILEPITLHAPNGIRGEAKAAIEQLKKG
jgi:aminopeptidase N